MRDFLECTAVITGASAGIGREMARQLAQVAGTLILVARRSDRLAALRRELLEMNPGLRVVCETVDLGDQEQVAAFAQRLLDEGVELDFLINNAGFGDAGTFESSEWATIEKMLQVNVVALTCLCHQLIPVLRRHRPGAILNVSSIASLLPVPRLAVYAATKAYVSSFSEGLRAELRGTGISVTHLCPGPVDTEFQQAARRAGEPEREHAPAFVKVSAAAVARVGLRAVARDRARVFPGFWINALALGLALLPMFILRMLLNSRSREPHRPGDLAAGQPTFSHP
jgi:short-subunit dehydrogenase